MIKRRKFLISAAASAAVPFLANTRPALPAQIPTAGLLVASVSWIDKEGLPQPELFSQKSLLSYWPARVAAGLAATRNPRPNDTLASDFQGKRQFRAFIEYRIQADGTVTDAVLDPGTTPAVDSANIERWNHGPYALGFYDNAGPHPGQKSPISGVTTGRLHPNSTLKLTEGAEVITSALIKFRAGVQTDNAGVNEAKSPFHVPWVWCEHAIIRLGSQIMIIANGSRFPSHAWFANQKKVAQLIQAPVTISDKEPAFVTGAPAVSPTTGDPTPFDNPNDDKSVGPITSHEYTVEARSDAQIRANISLT